MEKRIDKINYYLNIAKSVADRSTCLRKKSGAVIVNHDEIVSTGYSGAPRGRENCIDLGYCCKKKFFPDVRHAGYDACRSVHAEQNAIAQAARLGISLSEATLYCTHQPCVICAKMIINSGIKRIVFKYGYPDEFAMQLFKEANVSVEQYDEE